MTQKSLLHAVAAQIANGYETAEVPMYSEHLRMPDRKVIIKIIENLQKVFFPAYFAGGTVSHVSAETFAEFLLGEIYTDLREQVHLAFSNTIADESELRERTNAVCDRFLCRLPQIQTILMKDVTANFDGDPAAGSKEEVIFSYPGLGNTMYKAVVAADYPLISACTLIITIMVLLANFLLDIVYGLIDPRVKAAQVD